MWAPNTKNAQIKPIISLEAYRVSYETVETIPSERPVSSRKLSKNMSNATLDDKISTRQKDYISVWSKCVVLNTTSLIAFNDQGIH